MLFIGRIKKNRKIIGKKYFMVLWHLGILASWHLGILASWHLGILASWHLGILASWHLGILHLGILESWHLGISASWHLGILAFWHHSILVFTRWHDLGIIKNLRNNHSLLNFLKFRWKMEAVVLYLSNTYSPNL